MKRYARGWRRSRPIRTLRPSSEDSILPARSCTAEPDSKIECSTSAFWIEHRSPIAVTDSIAPPAAPPDVDQLAARLDALEDEVAALRRELAAVRDGAPANLEVGA